LSESPQNRIREWISSALVCEWATLFFRLDAINLAISDGLAVAFDFVRATHHGKDADASRRQLGFQAVDRHPRNDNVPQLLQELVRL
jgi:hypothetical protein